MILKGNSRANGAELAIHLMKDENEHIEFELEGFASDDLIDAFLEVQAISRATKCRKYLYSLSLNPPAKANAAREDFIEAIQRVEETLGLEGQARAVVFHTKEGRTHAHAVWSRINPETMKAIKLDYPKRKLNGLALELFQQHGWEVPAGFLPGQEADPMNYTYAEYQEAKRGNREAKHFKAQIKASWNASDNRQSFEAALERSGLFLAQGDRRGFVCVDYEGNIYSLSRWSGVKSKELAERLGEPENLQTVEAVKAMIAERMTPRLKEYVAEVSEAAIEDLRSFEAQRREMTERHRIEREALNQQHKSRWDAEGAERAARFSTGLKGLWHRVTGKHVRIAQENELEAQRSMQRDEEELKELKERQRLPRQKLQERLETAKADYNAQLDALHARLAEYAAMGQEPELKREDRSHAISHAAKFDHEQ